MIVPEIEKSEKFIFKKVPDCLADLFDDDDEIAKFNGEEENEEDDGEVSYFKNYWKNMQNFTMIPSNLDEVKSMDGLSTKKRIFFS